MKMFVLAMLMTAMMVLGLSSLVQAQGKTEKVTCSAPESEWCPSQEELDFHALAAARLVKIAVDPFDDGDKVKISCYCKNGEKKVKINDHPSVFSPDISGYCLRDHICCQEPAAKPPTNAPVAPNTKAENDKPTTTQNPAPAQLTCMAPKLDGRVVCHISAQVPERGGAYECSIERSCYGGFSSALGAHQTCLGAIVCRPAAIPAAAKKAKAKRVEQEEAGLEVPRKEVKVKRVKQEE